MHTFSLVVSDGSLDSAADEVDVVVVDPGAGQRYKDGGCSTTAASGGLLLALLGLVGRRKRA